MSNGCVLHTQLTFYDWFESFWYLLKKNLQLQKKTRNNGLDLRFKNTSLISKNADIQKGVYSNVSDY